jgi:hypothetical protein
VGDLEDVLIKFSTIARDLGIEYTIVGGIAILYHGVPRATMDIDCLVKADEKQLRELAKRMRKEGFFADEDDLIAMMMGEGHASIEDKKTMMRLDMFAPKDEFGMISLAEAMEVSLGGTTMRVASPETTIVSKLRFGSPQDVLDAEGIYGRLHKTLDQDKLERFAKMVGVRKELAALKKRVERLIASDGN